MCREGLGLHHELLIGGSPADDCQFKVNELIGLY